MQLVSIFNLLIYDVLPFYVRSTGNETATIFDFIRYAHI